MAAPTPDWETPTTRTWVLHADAECFEQRVEYAPGSPFPPNHLHPAQEERFAVEQGAMIYLVHGKEQRLEAGQVLEIAAQVPHKARNASADEIAVVRWETRPAMRTEAFFRTAGALGESGLLHGALLAHEYRDVFRATGLLGLLVPIVATVARILGRKLPEPVGQDVKES